MSLKFTPLLIVLIALLAVTPLCFATANQKVIFSNSGNKALFLNNSETGFEMQFRNQEYFLEEVDNLFRQIYPRVCLEGFDILKGLVNLSFLFTVL